jgi:hypothetical protein
MMRRVHERRRRKTAGGVLRRGWDNYATPGWHDSCPETRHEVAPWNVGGVDAGGLGHAGGV